MSEKKLTARQLETKIAAINDNIAKLKERIEKLNGDKKALQSEKRRQAAAKTKAAAKKTTTAKKTPAAKKTTAAAKKATAAKKTTAAKKPAAKKSTAASKAKTKKTPAKGDESLFDGVMDSLKDAGFNPEDLLKSILGGDKK